MKELTENEIYEFVKKNTPPRLMDVLKEDDYSQVGSIYKELQARKKMF